MKITQYSDSLIAWLPRSLRGILVFLLLSSVFTTVLAKSPRELEWDDLLPAEWDPNIVFEGYTREEFDALPDKEYNRLREKAQKMLEAAPTVDALDGELVKIPGFMLPLEFEDTQIREFLLVPYFGACVHTPPPPANQIIHGVLDHQFAVSELFEPVWISGKLRIQRAISTLGESGVSQTLDVETGYRMDVELVEPYVYSE